MVLLSALGGSNYLAGEARYRHKYLPYKTDSDRGPRGSKKLLLDVALEPLR